MSPAAADDEVRAEIDRLRAHVDAGEDTDRDRELRGLKARVVLEHMFQFTGLADVDGTLLEANQTALDAGGIERSSVIGSPVWEAHWFTVSETTQGRLREAVDRAVTSNELVRYDMDVYAGAGGASTVTIDFSARPVHDSSGDVAFLILEGRDIEERKRAQRLKEQMFANVSHELRTPLTLILGRVEVLLEEDLDDATTDAVRRVGDNARIMLAKVNDLLEVAALESERVEPQPRPFDVRRLVEQVASTFGPLADESVVELRVESGPAVPTRADPHHVHTILMNLVANACKATADGGLVVLAVRLEDEQVVLEVRDDGPGVPPEERERIFEPFHQVDRDAVSSRAGTGLGLAIVHELVAAMGGEVLVDHSPEGGALFQVRLPHRSPESDELIDLDRLEVLRGGQRVASLLAERRLGEHPDRPTSGSGAAGTGDLLLLVEDNADLLSFLVAQLSDSYRLVTAHDGREALEMLTSGDVEPDLIVTDLMMPVLSGDALLAKLQDVGILPGPPVLVLTARSGQELRERLLDGGASDYLTKPFTPHELRARIENLLEPVRLRGELEQRNLLLKEYASHVSHDLKGPLATVMGFAETVLQNRDRLDDAEVDEMLERIVANGHRLQRFVDDLLAEVRGSSRRTVVDLDEVLVEVEQLLAEKIDEHDVEVVVPDGLPRVRATPGAVRSVLTNLLDNAINYRNPERRLRVELEARRRGDLWEVVVGDNGRGVTEDDLEKVLERGQRGGQGDGQGTGLGLYECQQLLVRHGGELWIEAAEGVGAEVHFTLPAAPVDEPVRD